MSDILRYYLDLLRGENDDRFGLHNVLSVMKRSRNNYILNECFDGIELQNEPLVDIHFSDEDGKNASSFRGCKVSRSCFLSGHSAPVESMEFIDDNTLVSMSVNEVITWDIKSGVPINSEKLDSGSFKSVDSLNKCDDELFISNEMMLERLKELFDENSGFIIYTTSPDNRFFCYSDNTHQIYLYDFKTKNSIVFSDTAPPWHSDFHRVMVKADSYYTFIIQRSLYVFDLNNISSKPELIYVFSNEPTVIKTIKNTHYILIIEHTYGKSRIDTGYIIDLDTRKIVNCQTILTLPSFIPELGCLFIKHSSDYAELIDISTERIINKFFKVKFVDDSSCFKVSKNKKMLAVSAADYGIYLYSICSSDNVKILVGNTAAYKGIVALDRKRTILYPHKFSLKPWLMWNITNNHLEKRFYNSTLNITTDCCVSFAENKILMIRFCHESYAYSTSEEQVAIDLIDFDTGLVNFSFNELTSERKYVGNYLNINLDYSGKFFFYLINEITLNEDGDWQDNVELHIYDDHGIHFDGLLLSDSMFDTVSSSRLVSFVFSSNTDYFSVPYNTQKHERIHYDNIAVLNRHYTWLEYDMHYPCICPLRVSNDGRYVTVVTDVNFDNSIIKTEVLDMHEQKVCSEETIENDYILLNYLRQYVPKQQKEYTSSGWTIKVPSSPDNSTEALIYLVPNLYISGCDFRGSTFDDETKEIIRQYNGIV